MNYGGRVDRLLCESSQLHVRLRDRYCTWQLGTDLEPALEAAPVRDTVGAAGPEQFEITLRMWCRLARAIGAVPMLCTEARLVARDNDAEERSRINYGFGFSHAALCDAYETADRSIRKVGEAEGAVVLDPAAEMARHPESFVDHVHTTPAGSARLAAIMARELGAVLSRAK